MLTFILLGLLIAGAIGYVTRIRARTRAGLPNASLDRFATPSYDPGLDRAASLTAQDPATVNLTTVDLNVLDLTALDAEASSPDPE
jgi:hypothetical protein